MSLPKWADLIERGRSKNSEGFLAVNVFNRGISTSVDNKTRAAGSGTGADRGGRLVKRAVPPRAARNNSSGNFAALGPSYAALYGRATSLS